MSDGAYITIFAYGEAKMTPEIATVSFGIVTEAEDPSEALQQNAKQMSSLIAALHDVGIAPEDLKTTNISLAAQYQQKADQPHSLRGYQVRNTVSATLQDPGDLGNVLTSGVGSGANNVGNVLMKARDTTEALREARRFAIENLAAAAENYAQLLGRTVKALKSLEEQSGVPQHLLGEIARGGGGGISTGQLTVRVDLKGVFELS